MNRCLNVVRIIKKAGILLFLAPVAAYADGGGILGRYLSNVRNEVSSDMSDMGVIAAMLTVFLVGYAISRGKADWGDSLLRLVGPGLMVAAPVIAVAYLAFFRQ